MSAHQAIRPGATVPASFGVSSDIAGQERSDTPINAYLRSLPPLHERADDGPREIRCKMCGGPVRLFACVDFNKSCHPSVVFEDSGVLVDYVRCDECDFLFTTFCDRWTTRDFADLIYNDDYLAVDGEFLGERARRTADSLSSSLDGAQTERILDYGSGSGEFSAALREIGFVHAANYDPYTHPHRPTGTFAIVTAFDVIEHSPDPLATLHDMLHWMTDDGCLLNGQSLQPADIETIRGDWWYLAPRNGHISMFSEETIRGFAEANALDLHNFGAMFALSRPQRSDLVRQVIARNQPIDRRILLPAPGRVDGEPFGWHPLEQDGGRPFRWTAHEEVDLGTVVMEGDRELAVPVHIAMDPRFLSEARLKIGGVILPLRLRRRKWLVADFTVDRKLQCAVSLLTPRPVRPPTTPGNDDRREMGIAIFARPPAAAD